VFNDYEVPHFCATGSGVQFQSQQR